MRKPVISSFEDAHRSSFDAFECEELPAIGQKVEVLATVAGRTHVIPFTCCWSEEGWVVAGTRRPLAFTVVGWRRTSV